MIGKAKQNQFESTARDSLLFIAYLTNAELSLFEQVDDFYKKLIDIINNTKDEKKITSIKNMCYNRIEYYSGANVPSEQKETVDLIIRRYKFILNSLRKGEL
jgi:hypothetical protein